MTPEQYVHTLAFRDQGFSSDRMPQYRDHAEASQDVDDDFGMGEDGQDSIGFNGDDEDLLAGTVQDSRESLETVDNSHSVAPDQDKKDAEQKDPEAPAPVLQESKPSPHPNMKVYWESKTFADVKIVCDGGVITAHRLVLAARNTFFYQILLDCADEDFSVIMMPDHSFDDISAMVQGFYDFKASTNAFAFNSDKTVLNQNDEIDINVDQVSPRPHKIAKLLSIPEKTNLTPNMSQKSQFSSSVAETTTDDPGEVSQHRTAAGNDTLDRLILKEGSTICPTYSCKIPGCKFSVQNSLMCIKGHILTEHWGNLG